MLFSQKAHVLKTLCLWYVLKCQYFVFDATVGAHFEALLRARLVQHSGASLQRGAAPHYSIKLHYRSIPDKRPCTKFQGVNVAASIQMYAIYIPGKRSCGPKSRVMFKRPWALTWEITVVPPRAFGSSYHSNNIFNPKFWGIMR